MIRKTYRFKTNNKIEVLNITELALNFINQCKIENGIINIFTPHTTGALVVNEDEVGLKKDILKMGECLTEHLCIFEHNKVDHNAAAHLLQTFYSCSISLPVESKNLMLGAWQSILFLEFDGSRERLVILTIF